MYRPWDPAILYYDYSLALGTEVDRFWRVGRWTFANVLFVLNRYLALLGTIPVIFEFFGDLPHERFHKYYTIVSQTIVIFILNVRTYALYAGNTRVIRGLVALNLVMVIVVVVIRVSQFHAVIWASLWIILLVFDLTILVLTLVKALTMRESVRYGLLRVLFRDGELFPLLL
ncbi:hypothetical protein GY45DRAFT_1254664 [Cubamyces sp. BRFM 1775]|nr:hypothetical protein GY45DRAFT_1254664 [Cubamyces sp. BRFM 1775]